MKRIVFFAILVFFATGCKKEEFEIPDQVSETPIFTIRGAVGENQVDMQAGVDGAYIETFVSMFNQIDFFSGKMIKGKEQFSVSVSNGDIGLTPTITAIPTHIPFAVSPGYWFVANMQNIPSAQQILSLDFVLNDISFGNNISIPSVGFHSICTNVKFQDGTTRFICNKILLGYKDHGAFRIKTNQNTGSTNLWVESSSSVSSVEWSVDGEAFSNGQQAILGNGNGVVVVKAKTTFTNGIVREHEIIVDTDQQGRNFQDLENYKLALDQGYFHDFKVVVSFEREGKTYISYSNADYPGEFKLSSISLFKEKSSGGKVYKVEGVINGRFMDLLSGDLLPSQLEVVFAVELPY